MGYWEFCKRLVRRGKWSLPALVIVLLSYCDSGDYAIDCRRYFLEFRHV